MRVFLTSLSAVVVALSPRASACTLVAPPVDQVMKEVVTQGVMFSGTVVRTFDPSSSQLDILHADTIFIGDAKPRDFVIFRSKYEIEAAKKPSTPVSCSLWQPHQKLGERVDKVFLVPAGNHHADPEAKGKWAYVDFYSGYFRQGGLQKVIRAASKAGRLRVRPKADY